MRRLVLISCLLLLASGADAWTPDGSTRIVIPPRRADSAVWEALNASAVQFGGAVTERTPHETATDADDPGTVDLSGDF